MFRHALTITMSLLSLPLLAADDLVVADFEGTGWNTWTVEGDAFGPGPVAGALPQQKPVSGFVGKCLVNSFHGQDRTTGRLASPAFTIERERINLLVGGGAQPEQLAVRLVIDGAVVQSATGNSKAGDDPEETVWVSWPVAQWRGKTATIEIVDRATGGWGHILVDQITQSDHKPKAEISVERVVRLDKRWLVFPVKNGAPKRTVTLHVGGSQQREFVIELAMDGTADFWSGCDVTAYQGRDAVVRLSKGDATSPGWTAITTAEAIPGTDDLYREALRPQFHFSAQRGWLNDPNGLVFHAGEYHLYFQHNPFGVKWENMHWGHAVSRDLVRWQELPPVLWQRHAFSGSAAVDHANTGGYQTGKEPALIAAWTSTDRGECIAFSNDHGRTFTEIPQNPVVKHDGRDPKIFWHAPTKQWVMVLYNETAGARDLTFHTSTNLRQWTYRSRIAGFFECPELFELAVDGKADNTRWVLTGANGHYLLGRFDGATFTPDHPTQIAFPATNDVYAAQTYNDIPASDGRRIHVGWFRNEFKGMPFNQCMAFPTELTLRTTPAGIRLCAVPVREIAVLHDQVERIPAGTLTPGDDPLAKLSGELLDVRGSFVLPEGGSLALTLRGVAITYDAAKQELTCGGRNAPLALVGGRLDLRVLVDRTSVEVYAGDGLVYMPLPEKPAADNRSLHLTAGAGTRITMLEVATLRSAWERK